ncbi:uncharacterized protein F5891DRAFT_1179190 [Suillus fuscotomentosus]|uniref:Uncharacterized protein n=1 Tax=Suillus fuscotomentosus TaxID=1912939 RepID=A0AAD4DMR3_9AGAM|nr:uncharacterized protein F5891DRAFT_1179190 [Suillus fuscotomentosus]KAG1883530.1 hypothetical protein F5891DRAFT_1179190 [Suillus fuscotomentosus]
MALREMTGNEVFVQISVHLGIRTYPLEAGMITICVTSDILAIGADHLKDKEEEFSLDPTTTNNPCITCFFMYARTFLAAHVVLLALVLSRCPMSTLLATAMFVVPALLWTTPISFKKFWLISRRLHGRFGRDNYQPSRSAPELVIKRVPGMKAIFNGTIRGRGIYAVVFSVLSGSGNLTSTLPSPWSVVQLIIMADVRDFEEDMKAGVPTIPVLLGSILKIKVILTLSIRRSSGVDTGQRLAKKGVLV